jgi:O-antigen/teichoic acid export membrane protein
MHSPLRKFKTPLLFADQAVFSGSSFLVTILLARSLSVGDFGAYAGLLLILYLISSLIGAFVVQPLQVSLPAVDNKEGYLNFTFWLQLLGSTILIGLIPLLLLLPLDILAQYTDLTGPIVLLSIGFVMHDYFRKRLLTEDRIADALVMDVLLVTGHLSATGFIFNMDAPTMPQVLALLGMGYLPGFVTGAFFTSPSFSGFSDWATYLKTHVDQGKWLFYTALVQWWAGNMFVVASGIFLGAAALGALRLVQSVFGVLNVLFQTFENYVLPQTANHMHQSMDEGRRFLKRIGGQSLLGVGTLLLVLFIFSDFIIALAGGAQFREYGFLVKGMSVLYALIFAGYPVRIAIRALVMNKIFFKGYVLTFIFGLFSSYLLLSQFHLAGAIAGLIVSQLILITYWQLQLQKKEFLLWK